METMALAILMGGGPAVVYACKALEAFDQFVSSGQVLSASAEKK
jgi:hypothetical protein